MLLLLLCFIMPLFLLLLFFIWIHTAPLRHGGEEAIVILGYKCDGNEIHPLLMERLTIALKLIHSRSYRKVIVLGGMVGSSSITEAEIMRDYLVRHGINYDMILLDKESKDTIENFINCKEILELENIRSCIAISNSFHIRRMHYIANALDLNTSFYACRSWRTLFNQIIRTLLEIKLFILTYRVFKNKT